MAAVKATVRDEIGSRRVKALRRRGMVPGIIYGHKEVPVPIALSEHDIELAVRHHERVLEVDLAGQTLNALVKEVQWDTFGHEVIHVDLCRVGLDERVEVTVPVVCRGAPAGAADGGVLRQNIPQVKIECLVTAIPEEIRVPVAHLNVGDVLHLRDLALPEGAKLLGDPEAILCTVSVIAEVVEAPVAAAVAAAEPEVIGAKKEEGEEAPAESEKAHKAEKAEKGEKAEKARKEKAKE